MDVKQSYIVIGTRRGESTREANLSANCSSSKLAKARKAKAKEREDEKVSDIVDASFYRDRKAKYKQGRAAKQRAKYLAARAERKK